MQYDTDANRGGNASAQFNGSKVQKWLNGIGDKDFLQYFIADERVAISTLTIPESVKRSDNSTATNFTSGSSKVFMFNLGNQDNEIELDSFINYFKNNNQSDTVVPFDRIGNDLYFQKPSHYWTRSCGDLANCAAVVIEDGGLGAVGVDVGNGGIGVRPALKINLQSVIFKSLINSYDLKNLLSFEPQDSAGGGEISEAYMLYCTSADVPGTNVRLSVNTTKLTVSFDQPVAHAYNKDTLDVVELGKKFVVSDDTTALTVKSATVEDGKLVLTLSEAFVYGADTSKVAIAYKGLAAGDTDGVGLLTDRIAMKRLNSGNAITGATNTTPAPDPGGDPDPGKPSTATTPGKITVTIGGTAYEAEAQSGGGYLILLPYGTDPALLKDLPLGITLLKGAVISPDPKSGVDFSNGPVTFTITAEDKKTTQTITVTIRIAEPQTVEGTVVAADASRSSVIVTYNADGTLSVEIGLPVVSGFDLTTLDGLYALLSRLTSLSFAYVDGGGNVVPLTPRTAGDAYLRITGTAADKAALEGAALSSLSYWLKNDATEYRQTLSPVLNLSDMRITYTNEPPTEPEESGGSGSSGCDAGAAGFGVLGMLGLLVAGCHTGRRGK